MAHRLGPARTTLKDVAEAAGVAISTASRALADSPVVAEDTKERVRRMAASLGYRPNAQARALQSSRTNTIGVLVPSVINHYFATMVTVIQQVAAENRLLTMIVNTGEDGEAMSVALEQFAEQGVDGVICVPQEDGVDSIVRLHEAGLPIVLIDRELTGCEIPTITSDPEPGMWQAVDVLQAAGAVPIGYLSGPMSTSTGRARLHTFQEACRHAGLTDQPVYRGGYTQEQGLEGAKVLLGRGVKSMFAGDSMMTIGVIEACHDQGLEIGKDIAVVGFDKHPLFELQPSPITVIDQNVSEMAQRAFAALLTTINGSPPTTVREHTTTTLIQRESTLFVGSNND